MENTSIKEKKQNLRIKILKKRDSLSIQWKEEYDATICEQIWETIQKRQPKKIHTFIPFRSEINIFPIINNAIEAGISVYSSKTLKNRKLSHLKLSSINSIEIGQFQTPFPSGEEEYDGKFDLIIIPGLAFDKNGFRLGYGGGYYDEFLLNQKQAFTIAPCYPFQVLDKIPIEKHDEKIDQLLYM